MNDELELNKLITDVLENNCNPKDYPNICSFIKDPYGKKKIFKRIKNLAIFSGIDNLLVCLNQIELELS
jgi:hypothetical protein